MQIVHCNECDIGFDTASALLPNNPLSHETNHSLVFMVIV